MPLTSPVGTVVMPLPIDSSLASALMLRRASRRPPLYSAKTNSVDTRGCSRGRHIGEPGGKEPCRRCRRRNGRRWPAASRHRGFRRFCRASGGVSGHAWRC